MGVTTIPSRPRVALPARPVGAAVTLDGSDRFPRGGDGLVECVALEAGKLPSQLQPGEA